MKNLKTLKTLKTTAALLFAASLIILPLFSIRKLTPEPSLYMGVMGALIIFMSIINSTRPRLIKGMGLIIFGVTFQLIYTKLFIISLNTSGFTTEDPRTLLKLYTDVILFACSGAGGSIVALYADKNSSDNDDQKSSHIILTEKQLLKNINISITNLHSRFNTVIITISLIFLASLAFIAFAALK